MKIELRFWEWLPILSYLIFLLAIGFRKTAKRSDEDSFILDSRRLTLPGFVATLVTTWYGGILGVGEFSYLYGISNWFVFGLPYYIFAILFAIFLAPKVRLSGLYSIPDQLYRHYGRQNGLIGTFYTLMMTLPAAYVLMVAFLLQLFTGWPLWVSIILSTLFSMAYVGYGGFRSVVRTDKLQFLLMFGGFGVLILFLGTQFGGLAFLRKHVPPTHFSLTGGNSWSFIIIWFFIALWTMIDPGFHQRCYAARDEKVARKGILISVLFWFIFDAMTTTAGLYARALLSDINPSLGYPLLAHRLLPPLLSGLFLTGLFATIMSTVDSMFLLSSITIGHDLWARLKGIPKVKYTRIGLAVSAIASVVIALLVPSVVQIWYLVGTLFVPPLLLPLLGAYFPAWRLSAKMVTYNLVLAFGASLLWLVISAFNSSGIMQITAWLGIQPIYPGLAVSIIIYIIGKLKKGGGRNC